MRLKKMSGTPTMRALGALLLAAVVAAGCSGSKDGQNGNAANDGSGPSNGDTATNGNGYPESFTYWAGMDPNVAAVVKNFNDIAAYKEVEAITGTKVEFQNQTDGGGGEIQQKFNLMIASRQLPDVIEADWLHAPRGPQDAIDSGTILRLNDLIDRYAPNFKQYLQEHPDIERMIQTDSGDIYAFPFIRGDKSLLVSYGPAMRKDWLDKLGLQPPTTIDEWEQTLKAFKEGDPNGNGQQDEIPFLFSLDAVLSQRLNQLIGAWGIAAQFYQQDGKIHFGEIEPPFKDFVATMREWYEKGWIDPDFAATDTKLLDAKVTGDHLGALYLSPGSGIGKYMDLMRDKEPQFELIGVLNPTMNKGEKPALGMMDPPYPGANSTAITTAAKHPEQIVKWLDLAYGEQGHMLFNFGTEGESYTMENGNAQYTPLILHNPDGLPVNQAMAKYIRASTGGPFVQDKRYIEQYMALPQQREAIETWSDAENRLTLPGITMTADENKQFSSIMSDVNTYTTETITKMIIGEVPFDQFDKFVETVKGFGIEQAIQIQQAALDRYNQR